MKYIVVEYLDQYNCPEQRVVADSPWMRLAVGELRRQGRILRERRIEYCPDPTDAELLDSEK